MFSPHISRFSIFATATGLFMACGGTAEPLTGTNIRSTIDLAAATSLSSPTFVGVTVEPDTGRRYALDASQGLWELDENGSATHVLTPLHPQQQSPLTDIVALGNGRFALTAMNDGFLLDLADGNMASFFCYEPGFIPGVDPGADVYQLTQSVTFDARTQRMYAQPQTFDTGTNEVLLSQVGQFEMSGGEGFGWVDMPRTSFLAGGMAPAELGALWLGAGSELHQLNMDSGVIALDTDLSELGISDIQGLAALSDSELWVLDGTTGTSHIVELGR